MKIFVFFTIAFLAITVFANQQHKKPAHFADSVYYNGTIITMDQKHQYPSFIAITNSTITAVSTLKSSMKSYIGPQTKVIDLQGKTLLPGLIDSHSHFSMSAVIINQGFQLSSPPFGSVKSIPDILNNIRNYITEKNLPPGQTVFGNGYSDLALAQNRHPTRFELDSVSTVHPIFLKHFTSHLYACNTLGLKLINYTDDSPNPVGGILDRFLNGSLTGVIREAAKIPITVNFEKTILKLTPQEVEKASKLYFSCGITTAHEMSFTLQQPEAYHKLGDKLPIYINGYSWITQKGLDAYYFAKENYDTQKFKTNGVKFVLDGSIQLFTAWLSKPYWVPKTLRNSNLQNYTYDSRRSCQTQDCGVDFFHDHQLLRTILLQCYQKQIKILTHSNGDKAIDAFLDAIQWVKKTSKLVKDTRIVIIHSQTVREDQLDRMKALNVHPSFFISHIYYWGEKHYNIFLGPERASRLSPVKSAIQRNLTYTLHNDAPVVAMGVYNGINTFLQLLEIAVNRKTSSGRVLGQDQRISIYEALKGLTINAAWQAGIQDTKGSIQEGKQADLVILSKNPLNLRADQLGSIQVVTTIVKDKIVYGNYPEAEQFDQQLI